MTLRTATVGVVALIGALSMPAAALAQLEPTAATVWLVRRLAKRNRVAAIASMVAIDAAYAAVVARNFHVASRR